MWVRHGGLITICCVVAKHLHQVKSQTPFVQQQTKPFFQTPIDLVPALPFPHSFIGADNMYHLSFHPEASFQASSCTLWLEVDTLSL